MKHYTAEEWADFVRGVVASDLKSLMEKHLGTCSRCAREASVWQRVTGVAKREALEPSAGAVRQAKALFAIQGLQSTRESRVTVAQLLFDSMRTPLLAGVRSTTATSRQLLFSAGNHRIDVRVEPQIHTEKAAITGQILDANHPETMLQNIPVSLHVGKQTVAVSEANHLGEFQFECALTNGLELRAKLAQGREISVILADQGSGDPQTIDSKSAKSSLREGKKSTRTKV